MVRFRTTVVKGGMDMKFVVRNWKAINESPVKKAGLLVRTIMRGSIRRATISKKTGKVLQKPSAPGKPPRSRYQGHPFKLIFSVPFADDTKAIIGHKKFTGYRSPSGKTAMELHEFGRTARIRVFRKRNKARSAKQRKAARKKFLAGQIKQTKTPRTFRFIKMPRRPYARPALAKAKGKLGHFWRGVMKLKRGKIKSRF